MIEDHAWLQATEIKMKQLAVYPFSNDDSVLLHHEPSKHCDCIEDKMSICKAKTLLFTGKQSNLSKKSTFPDCFGVDCR